MAEGQVQGAMLVAAEPELQLVDNAERLKYTEMWLLSPTRVCIFCCEKWVKTNKNKVEQGSLFQLQPPLLC